VRQSIDFDRCEIQPGDEPVPWFSYWREDVWADELHRLERSRTWDPATGMFHVEQPPSGPSRYPRGSILAQAGGQVPCYLTHTTPRTRELILANLHLSPMYSGVIEGVGPRYCPSIEDKFVRFADKEQHQVFLEPEGIATDEIYVNGFSTSLPFEVQVEMVKSIAGCERAEILRPAYAVEYDFVQPTQLTPALETKTCRNLFLAGQINGTSGYEEAGAQGLMAGINAARRVQGRDPVVLRRDQAYVGVLIDDLITKGTKEPYRMFTSRAEYRLLLRQDNADLRLSALGHELGLLSGPRAQRVEAKRTAVAGELARLARERHGEDTLLQLLRRPELTYATLPGRNPGLAEEVALQVEIEAKYAGYITRQEAEVKRFRTLEDRPIPAALDYRTVPSLRIEARLKLEQVRPATLGQAARISGVSPADLSLVMVWLKRMTAVPAASPTGEIRCAAEEHQDEASAHNQCCGDL
jgi:tRNA uridine 5-carboxymethylaminomethyl modification enzyme